VARRDPMADPRSYDPHGLSGSRPFTGGLADDLTAVSGAVSSHVQRHAEREDNEQRHERCRLMDERREDERDQGSCASESFFDYGALSFYDNGIRDRPSKCSELRCRDASRARSTLVLAGISILRWIILGWVLTWAAVELGMLQGLLDTTSLTGRQWILVLALALIAPAIVAADKAIRLLRQRRRHGSSPGA
jgi:hypothetical protein